MLFLGCRPHTCKAKLLKLTALEDINVSLSVNQTLSSGPIVTECALGNIYLSPQARMNSPESNRFVSRISTYKRASSDRQSPARSRHLWTNPAVEPSSLRLADDPGSTP